MAATLGDRPSASSRRVFRLSSVVERGEVSLWCQLYLFLYFIKKTNSQYSGYRRGGGNEREAAFFIAPGARWEG